MLGPKTEERDIDGLRVSTTQLPPVRALVLSKRLLPIVAPLFGSAEGLAGGGGLAELDVGALGEAFGSLDDAALVQLLLKTFANTTVQVDGELRTLNDENAINAVFMGRFTTMLRAAWFAIEVNFFPGGVDDLLASPPAKKPNRSTSAT